MAVYVDNPRIGYGRMKMCHMHADSTDELLKMAARIGVRRKWIQKPGTSREHFDVCLDKRKAAIVAGAIPVSSKDLVRLIWAKEGRV